MQMVEAFLKWMSLIALAGVLMLGGCASAKQYQLHGEIKGLDADQHVATIKHEEIPGFMGAMTMGYPIKDAGEFSRLTVGEAINATLYVKGDEMWLANIQKAK
ncbi:MAG TPA: copper-binding protein [Bryobacteraceae bacterium]|jgi:protein SCO1/2|nr:copper-binding protein [Bryobacteraceae bacterium]